MPKERKLTLDDAMKIRPDALNRLVLESMYENKSITFDQAIASRVLKSVGLSPTKIAHIHVKAIVPRCFSLSVLEEEMESRS